MHARQVPSFHYFPFLVIIIINSTPFYCLALFGMFLPASPLVWMNTSPSAVYRKILLCWELSPRTLTADQSWCEAQLWGRSFERRLSSRLISQPYIFTTFPVSVPSSLNFYHLVSFLTLFFTSFEIFAVFNAAISLFSAGYWWRQDWQKERTHFPI